jgi:hypothetical protein
MLPLPLGMKGAGAGVGAGTGAAQRRPSQPAAMLPGERLPQTAFFFLRTGFFGGATACRLTHRLRREPRRVGESGAFVGAVHARCPLKTCYSQSVILTLG